MNEFPGYAAYRVFTLLFGLLPEPLMRWIGSGFGYVWSFTSPKKFAMVERHMRRVTGRSRVRHLARRVFSSYGRYWAEVFWARPRRVEAMLRHTSVLGLEHVETARAAGRGIILALPHLGNWEVAALEAARRGIPVAAVAEVLPNRRITDWFVAQRAVFHIEVILAAGRVMTRLEDRLRRGGTVALLSDRDLRGRGPEVVFFGEETSLPAGPAVLAERTGATILPVGTYFRPGRGHHLVVREPLAPSDAADEKARVRDRTQALAKVLEELVGTDPAQWHLLQPNWPSDRQAGT